jgi:hypothetical protein
MLANATGSAAGRIRWPMGAVRAEVFFVTPPMTPSVRFVYDKFFALGPVTGLS